MSGYLRYRLWRTNPVIITILRCQRCSGATGLRPSLAVGIGQERTVHVYYPMAVHPSAELADYSFDLKLNDLLGRPALTWKYRIGI
jgi:hypothetical protein